VKVRANCSLCSSSGVILLVMVAQFLSGPALWTVTTI
jgi:hypothetical protein